MKIIINIPDKFVHTKVDTTQHKIPIHFDDTSMRMENFPAGIGTVIQENNISVCDITLNENDQKYIDHIADTMNFGISADGKKVEGYEIERYKMFQLIPTITHDQTANKIIIISGLLIYHNPKLQKYDGR